MPDSVHYYNSAGKEVPYDSLSADMKALIDKDYSRIIRQTGKDISAKNQGPGIVPFFITLLVTAFVIAKIIKGLAGRKSRNDEFRYNPEETNANEEPRQYYTYAGASIGLKTEDVGSILVKHLPYYNHLQPPLKERFTERVMRFMDGKDFLIYSQQPYKEMPVLTSAAAIQLTFGLDDYMLPWFKYISIHPEEYFAHDSLRVLAGNVEGNNICIAWNQLLKGIKDETDGANVGLHEMAHALYYQHVEVQGEPGGKFSGHFKEVMEQGEEIYKLKTAQHILYTDYAYRNLQEFWAESVEIFFEKPEEMQRCYPEIYDTLKELLQQNPVNKINPVC